MHLRPLGKTGLNISPLAFGAGPVSGLLTGSGDDPRHAQLQLATVRRAIEAGLNWFDTAATYGQGQSERSLGAALAELGRPAHLHVATKVRLSADRLHDIAGQVRETLAASLQRLGLARVTLLQLHNSITARREDEPTSITPQDVLGPGGVLDALEALRQDGLVDLVGLTGIGQPAALRTVVESGRFDVIQVPYHLLNPSAVATSGPLVATPDTDYGGIIDTCAALGMGVMAIRVYAGGALADQPPSPHTHTTKFFPLDLYQRDQRRAARLATLLPTGMTLPEAALRFVLGTPTISSAIIGFGEPEHIDQALRFAASGPLLGELVERLVAG